MSKFSSLSLPISNSTTTNSSSFQQSSSSLIPPSFRLFLTRLSTNIHHAFTHCRPWLEFLDPTPMSRPQSFSIATSRLLNNLSYFKINYLAFLSICLAFSLISHPFSLISLLLLISAWLLLFFFRPPDQPIVAWGRHFSKTEIGWFLGLLTVVVLFFTSVGTVVMWAVMIGAATVCAHGAFRDPVDLFLDGQETTPLPSLVSDAFFQKFVNGAKQSAVGATARGVVSAV